MTEEDNHPDYPWTMYWRYVIRKRVPAKRFPLYRGITAVLASVGQYVWKHKEHTPFTDMWIAVAIIVLVYLLMFVAESVWSLVVLTPPKIYGEMREVIEEYCARNSFLHGEIRKLEASRSGPQVPPQEVRRRETVSRELRNLGEVGRKILVYIFDRGELNAQRLQIESPFGDLVVRDFIARVLPTNLIEYTNHMVRVKPELELAIEFVLSSEYSEALKDKENA